MFMIFTLVMFVIFFYHIEGIMTLPYFQIRAFVNIPICREVRLAGNQTDDIFLEQTISNIIFAV